MTNVFAVVGEHKTDQGRLLLQGDDGRYYAYGDRQGEVVPVRPEEDWSLDNEATRSRHSAAEKPRPLA